MPPKGEKRSRKLFSGQDDDIKEEETEAGMFTKPRPLKALFIKNLPPDTTEEEVTALHPGIKKVKLDISKSGSRTKYALLDFVDTDSAKDALQRLNGMELGGYKVFTNYLESSAMISYNQSAALSAAQDPLKLYVTGFGQYMTRSRLASLFPTAFSFTFDLDPRTKKSIGFAFIHYKDAEEAKRVYDSMQDVQFNGRSLVVMYGKVVSTLNNNDNNKVTIQCNKASPVPSKRTRLDDEDGYDEDGDDDDIENGES